MKPITTKLFISLLFICTSAFAAEPLPLSKIMQNLQTAGYTNIQKIEFEHGIYKAEAYTKQGSKQKLRINAETGAILKQSQPRTPPISFQQAVNNLEKAGYTNIQKIKMTSNGYKVKAFDKQGNKVKLKVDATGTVQANPKDND